ncbi:MAG: rod shape-determining protein MreC [Candidatus Moranbacteria bacterium]|nr:rod shape-determining protein MreC [Candidatus Moranbacteria bacterium]
MHSNLFSKKIIKFIFIIAILGLLVFLNPRNFFDKVREPVFKISYFFEKTFQVSADKVHSIVSTIFSIGSLKSDNEELSMQNSELTAQNVQLKILSEENESLRRQLELLPKSEFKLENAEVISRGVQGLNDWVVINKGANYGIKEGMTVVVLNKVMVGKVFEVLPNSSRVKLLTNTSSAVSALTIETNAKGIVKGEYGIGLILDMVLETSSLKVGDKVVTSSMSDAPEGFLIGKINEIRSSSDYLFQQAVITSPVDLSRIKFVSVVLGN